MKEEIMDTTQILKLNDEIIDGLCSFFKGADVLIQNDAEISLLYSYLLLQATGIERLQKIVYILDFSTQNGIQPTDKELKQNLGHGIYKIHLTHLKHHFESADELYNEKALQILTQLVNVKDGYRYTNFNLHSDERFSVYDHIVQILELNGLDYTNINDLEKVSWEIIDIILKKYISLLVNLIWHKEIGDGDIIPVCLIDYVVKGWQETNLEDEIKELLDARRVH